jgi:hypothetical protein
VYTKFLLTYSAIYRRNGKVLPLGVKALQPQSHFHLGTPNSISGSNIAPVRTSWWKTWNITWFIISLSASGGRAVWWVGLRLLHWWDRGLESRWGHAFSSFVFFVCYVGSDLYNELILYQGSSVGFVLCVCVCLCYLKTRKTRWPTPNLGSFAS